MIFRNLQFLLRMIQQEVVFILKLMLDVDLAEGVKFRGGVDGRYPSLDSSPLSLRATAENFSAVVSKFVAREVCIASQFFMTLECRAENFLDLVRFLL